jgi:hypothetical protein
VTVLELAVRKCHAQLSTILLGNKTGPDSTKKQANEAPSPECELPNSRNDPVILFLVFDICIHPIVLPELQDSENDLIRLAS